MSFTIERTVPAGPEAAWAALTDLVEHGRHVPLTTVSVPSSGLRLGAEVRAVTRLGPLSFVDSMLVTAIEPGRRLRLVKTGRLLRGWAEVRIGTRADGTTTATWTEELWLPGLRRLTRPVGDRLGAVVFGRLVDGLLAGAAPGAEVGS